MYLQSLIVELTLNKKVGCRQDIPLYVFNHIIGYFTVGLIKRVVRLYLIGMDIGFYRV